MRLGVSSKDDAIVKTVIALIQNLGMKAVAEGVEERRQVDFLIEEGCRIIQGFYYYRPMPAGDIEELLKTNNAIIGPVNTSFAEKELPVDIYINRYLDALGVKHANKGYRYLVTAIRIGVEKLCAL